MLSLRLIRQLADRALLGRSLSSPCCRRRISQCSTRRTVSASPTLRHDFPPVSTTPRRSSVRPASSSTLWKSRQTRDRYAKEAKVRGLKSRAAFKLLEMNQRYRLFKPGATVVDLGYAPGSWSQVAIDRTQPGGRVVGIDIIPTQPPRGVSTIQGNFLSEAVQAEVRAYVQDPERGRAVQRQVMWSGEEGEDGVEEGEEAGGADGKGCTEEELEEQERGYIDRERRAPLIARADEEEGPSEGHAESADGAAASAVREETTGKKLNRRAQDEALGRVVDVVLSDMMMNTSGMAFRDHAGSMDLCHAALTFAFDTLRTGGNFVCKYYQGSEDKALEKKLRRMFEKVFREKPESSRSESKEAFFVALKRKPDPSKEEVFREI